MSEDEAYDVLSTRSSSFEDKSMAVKTLGGTESSLATLVLKAIDTGTLYFDKKEGGLYTSTKNGSFISVTLNDIYSALIVYIPGFMATSNSPLALVIVPVKSFPFFVIVNVAYSSGSWLILSTMIPLTLILFESVFSCAIILIENSNKIAKSK